MRQRSVEMYVDGNNLRLIGRQLRVRLQSVANWVKMHTAQLPAAPQPEKMEFVEVDKLHTFI